jgi:hypothetical protein
LINSLAFGLRKRREERMRGRMREDTEKRREETVERTVSLDPFAGIRQ